MTLRSDLGAACTTCGHFACVCGIRELHASDCKFLIAATGSVPIECDHGRDCCPECDPCTCGAGWGRGAGLSEAMLARAKVTP